jgi:hypothetical protein
MLPVKLEQTILNSLFHRLIPINLWSINKKPNNGSKMTLRHIVSVVTDIKKQQVNDWMLVWTFNKSIMSQQCYHFNFSKLCYVWYLVTVFKNIHISHIYVLLVLLFRSWQWGIIIVEGSQIATLFTFCYVSRHITAHSAQRCSLVKSII